MKKIMTLALALAFVTPMEANASCGAGQGSGMDVNATTKVVTYYCYDIVPPSQTELETQAKQRIEETLSQQANANPVTQVLEATITGPIVIDEPARRPYSVEVNATTGVITEREYSDEEMAQWKIDQATYPARNEARRLAQNNATSGTNTCVNWSALDMTGSECHYEPIPITQEEIDAQFEFIMNLFLNDWWSFFNIFAGIQE